MNTTFLKTIIATVVITIAGTQIPLNAKYRAYNVVNHPKVASGNRFIDITRNMKLNDNSIIRLSANDQLTVRMSSFNGPVYKLTTPTPAKGTSLKNLIAQKQKEKISTVRQVNKTIAQGLASHTVAKDAFDRGGVSHITTNSQGSITTLKYLLGPEEICPDELPAPMIKVTRRTDPDNLYHFILRSVKHDGLYVNMLKKDSDPNHIELLFPEPILITSTADRELDDFLFEMPDKYDAGMIVIVSDMPFTTKDIAHELNVTTQNIHRNYHYQIIR
ncbi:MAG: hypothetical protein K2M94_05815 [Paramuribaculum sp.]|nr:hypothetical protein [Paramuribaculum sp.]